MTFKRPFAWGLAGLIFAAAAAIQPAGANPTVSERIKTKQAAARLDAALNKALKTAGLKPAALADDATWARRTYLAVAGRIPTQSEIEAFVRANSTDKAHDLVDTLLAGKGYQSHMFNWWADLLRTRSRMPRRMSGEPYIHWLKDSLENNKPYDAMVKELLTAKGPIHKRDNGATGYLMRDRNMPEDNMSNTIRVFLGSRLECAQCHNHPFDKWTQREYFEMVAFTGGIRYQQNVRQNERVRRLSRQAQQKWGRNGVRALRRIYQNVTDGIYGTGTGGARLPKDYKYEDAKPQSWVFASAIMGPKTTVTAELPNEGKLRERLAHKPQKLERILRRLRPKEIDSRETFANWMTSPRNERFAKVIANRLWKRAMGRGLIEPVDDIKDTTKSVAPELMAELTDLVVELEFDLKELQRVMLYTRHWRRAAVVPDSTPGTLKDQRGPLLRRMTAEQIWDSLLTLVVRDIDKTIDPAANPRVEEVYSNFETLANGGDEEILRRTELLALRYSSPEKFRAQRRKEQMRIRDEQRRLRTAARPLFKELARARRDRDEEKIQRIVAELQQRGIRLAGGRAGRALRDMQRASDLPSPAPAGHLLAELGQSNRDLIEAGHTDPTVPQVLALLNAFIEQRLLLNNTAVLSRALTQARTPDATLRTAFWAVLNRAPTAREKSTWRTDISRNRKRGIQDLVWTLVNTHEFLFIQ